MWIMATTQTKLMTAEDLLAMPKDDLFHELLRGELITMAPAGFDHGDIGSELLSRLRPFVKASELGVVVGPDTGYVLSRSPDTVRAPDVSFVQSSRMPSQRPAGYFPGAPDLAVEVLSPRDTVQEMEDKVDEYLSAGTQLVWVVNPRRQTVSVYRKDGTIAILRRDDRLDGESVVPGFALSLAELFPKT
jgi:Uma2 family endonuclease